MSDEITLETCPFCLGEAIVEQEEGGANFSIGCIRCGCEMKDFETEEDAILAWSIRESCNKDEVEKAKNIILHNGHGGGNWRRLTIQVFNWLLGEDYETDDDE